MHFSSQSTGLLGLLTLFLAVNEARADVPVGKLIAFDGMNATGYACDTSSPGQPVKVHLYVNGPAGTGDYAGEGVADKQLFQSSSAAAGCGTGAHGFSIFLPVSARSGGPTLYAHAINLNNSGPNPLLEGAGTRVINKPLGLVDSLSNTAVEGWACDWDEPLTPLRIWFFDGPFENGRDLDQATTYSQGTSELCAGFAHRFFVSTTSMRSHIPKTIYVYADDVVSDEPYPRTQSWDKADLVPLMPPVHLGVDYGPGGKQTLVPPLDRTEEPRCSFFPNQLMGNRWYKPKGKWVNGHFEHALGDLNRWNSTLHRLDQRKGLIGTSAAEVGYISNSTINALRNEELGFSVETPSFTQCFDGTDLGNLDFNGFVPQRGVSVAGCRTDDLFCSIFSIPEVSLDRGNPLGSSSDPVKYGGWFITHDGDEFIPEQIAMDERMPNLLPNFHARLKTGSPSNETEVDALSVTQAENGHSMDWAQRKAYARAKAVDQDKKSACLLGSNTPNTPTSDLIDGFINDYVKYVQVMKSKWANKTPSVAIHWNVNANWEWSDESCLDRRNAQDPTFFNDPDALQLLKRPCHNSRIYLRTLLDRLCDADLCPAAVYMDVDWSFNTKYSTDNLLLLKSMIRRYTHDKVKKRIRFGVNLVEQPCPEKTPFCAWGYFKNEHVVRAIDRHDRRENQNFEESLLNLAMYLKGEGIYDQDVAIRVASWNARPKEVGTAINSGTTGSMPRVFDRIMEEVFKTDPNAPYDPCIPMDPAATVPNGQQ